MTTSDIKLRIFRQIDSLEKSKLEELYGVVVNYINSQKELTDWNSLTDLKGKEFLRLLKK